MSIESGLAELLGTAAVTTAATDLKTYGLDWTRFYTPAPTAVVFPRTAQEVIELVQFARSHKIGLVPSGGRTGLSGGACATDGEIVVSFDRMNQLVSLNASEPSATVEPGYITASLQSLAREQNLYYPVDFASSGSSQIGGNIATNAGGIRVIRYGLTRDWVTGLKVVTGSGELLELNRGLVKNATGYDLRHLFVGSEGTLGFIVEATMKLAPAPETSSVILLSVPNMERCLPILTTFKQHVTLNAFEFFSDNALDHVLAHSELGLPFSQRSPFYVLIECAHTDSHTLDRITTAFETCVENGHVLDAIISTSQQQSLALWQYRERISESITPWTPYKNDISVRVTETPAFLKTVNEMTAQHYPDFDIVWFGHIGDGNLHLNILKPKDWAIARFKESCDQLSQHVLSVVKQFGGSISAEHGVGLLKKHHLPFSRSAEEISALRAIKQVFDPDDIMNPGKLI